MSPIQFKLCNEEGTVRLATFEEPPNWEGLAARVHRIYGIPPADVGISYTDSEGYGFLGCLELNTHHTERDRITVTSNEELQDYYSTIPAVHTHPFKFNVHDQRPKRPPRPPTDILLNLDEQWTPHMFAVPLTPSQLHTHGEARIEEIGDEEGEKRSTGRSGIEELDGDDDDLKSYLDIPGRRPQEQDDTDDTDDASSIDSILENDLPDKKPIHVYSFSNGSHKAPSARSMSRSSAKSGSVGGSRSISTGQSRPNIEQFDMVNAEQFKSPRQSEYDILDEASPIDNLVDPALGRSQSRSPLLQSHNLPSREPSIANYSMRSSRITSQHPTPIIPTIDTTSPRGAPASFDMRSIPSPEPIVISVPSISEESQLLQDTANMAISEPDPPLPTLPQSFIATTAAANTTTTPSLTNDIASLLDALTQAFNEHPELSEGLRNIVRNASHGVYWNNATDAIRSIRDTVVSDALQARDVILTESASSARDISGHAQAEAGRKIAEALGNVFRSLGTVLGSNASAGLMEAAPFYAAASAPQVQTQTQTQRQEAGVPAPDSFLGAPHADSPRAGSPALIKATPLIHGQDIPPDDARSLSRPSSRSSSPDRSNNIYSSSVRVPRRSREKYGYPGPPYIPVVWGPPAPRGPNGERNAYGLPPAPVAIPSPMAPYSYSRSGHHRSQSSAAGGSAYPPPVGPPPGAYYMPSPYPSPYGYRYAHPDPDMYMDPRDYRRNGYPGVGAGANMRRSHTLPSTFTGPPPPPPPPPPAPIVQEASRPPPPQHPQPMAIISPPPVSIVATRSPAPSFGATSATETPGSSVVVVPSSAVSKKASLDDTYFELEEAKRLYKEKKEEYRREREERKIQKEKEKAQRQAEREARRLARLSGRGQRAPQPPVATLEAAPVSGNVSGSESGTEKALPIPPQSTAGPATSTPPRGNRSSTERLNKEVNDRLNAMGFTTRSYPQLNTLVPMHIRKHTMLSKGDVPDEVIVQHVLEDIFVPNLSSSSNKI